MNDLLEVGPPERGPGLLIRPSSRTAIKDELMMMASWFSPHANGGLALNHRPQLILTRRVVKRLYALVGPVAAERLDPVGSHIVQCERESDRRDIALTPTLVDLISERMCPDPLEHVRDQRRARNSTTHVGRAYSSNERAHAETIPRAFRTARVDQLTVTVRQAIWGFGPGVALIAQMQTVWVPRLAGMVAV